MSKRGQPPIDFERWRDGSDEDAIVAAYMWLTAQPLMTEFEKIAAAVCRARNEPESYVDDMVATAITNVVRNGHLAKREACAERPPIPDPAALESYLRVGVVKQLHFFFPDHYRARLKPRVLERLRGQSERPEVLIALAWVRLTIADELAAASLQQKYMAAEALLEAEAAHSWELAIDTARLESLLAPQITLPAAAGWARGGAADFIDHVAPQYALSLDHDAVAAQHLEAVSGCDHYLMWRLGMSLEADRSRYHQLRKVLKAKVLCHALYPLLCALLDDTGRGGPLLPNSPQPQEPS